MLSRKSMLWLLIGALVSSAANAAQGITDDLVVIGASDGTAPFYDCSPGATLPFLLPDLVPDPNAVTATIPAGDPIIVLEGIRNCVSTPPSFTCEYTCTTGGAACVGFDCVNGQSFAGTELMLRENNLRIRFDDSSIDPGLLGRSWNIEANSERNGGASYFDFQLKSLQSDTVRLVNVKDGPVPDYGCPAPIRSDPFLSPPFTDAVIGTLSVGDPVFDLVFASPSNCSGNPLLCDVDCVAAMGHEEKSLLTLGTANSDPNSDPILGNGVALGYESAVEGGVVSVGRADLRRRIAHVAVGIGGTDALTLADLELLAQQIAEANVQLDGIQEAIRGLETGPYELCGDVNADSSVDSDDVSTFRGFLADPIRRPLTGGGRQNCRVILDPPTEPRDCDILDVTVLRRSVAIPPLPPARAAVCQAAIGP